MLSGSGSAQGLMPESLLSPDWLLWWRDWAEGGTLCAGALLAWALALYVATRGGLRRVPVLTAAALALLAVYLLGVGLGTLTPEHPDWSWWLHRTWWAAALVPAAWLVVALLLYEEEGTALGQRALGTLLPWLSAGAVATGAVFAILGTLTDLVNVWSASVEVRNVAFSRPPMLRRVPAGPLFVPYEAYLVLCAAGAALVFLRLWRESAGGTPLRARFAWLSAAAVLFLVAGAALTLGIRWLFGSGLPGHLLLIAGIVIMGWNVARYGALVAGEVVTQDFWAFALSISAVLALYAALFVGIGSADYAWLRRSVPLLLVVTATHVLADTRSPLLDRLLYGPVSGGLRWQLRALAGRVIRQPDLPSALAEVRETVDLLMRGLPARGGVSVDTPPPSAPAPALAETGGSEPPGGVEPPGELRLQVEGALRHLNDVPSLSRHDLLDRLPPATGGMAGTALERAARLRAELVGAIERLAPPGLRPSAGPQAAAAGWLHHVVLHEAYVEGRPNKQVMQRYHLSEGTFHRARRRALDAVTRDLHERWDTRVAGGLTLPA